MSIVFAESDVVAIILGEGGIRAVQEYIVDEWKEPRPSQKKVRELAKKLGIGDHPALVKGFQRRLDTWLEGCEHVKVESTEDQYVCNECGKVFCIKCCGYKKLRCPCGSKDFTCWDKVLQQPINLKGVDFNEFQGTREV